MLLRYCNENEKNEVLYRKAVVKGEGKRRVRADTEDRKMKGKGGSISLKEENRFKRS